jgi:hypothetical protein
MTTLRAPLCKPLAKNPRTSTYIVHTSTPTTMPSEPPQSDPGVLRWVLGFLLVGVAWGLTNPFIRTAARSYNPPMRALPTNVLKRHIWKALYATYDLLRTPRYAVPLLINLTGSVWFFLLIGKAELSLTVPITNSLAFLFTVLGDYLAEGKVAGWGECCCDSMRSRGHHTNGDTNGIDTWVGMGFVCGGIGLCVHSKS